MAGRLLRPSSDPFEPAFLPPGRCLLVLLRDALSQCNSAHDPPACAALHGHIPAPVCAPCCSLLGPQPAAALPLCQRVMHTLCHPQNRVSDPLALQVRRLGLQLWPQECGLHQGVPGVG